MQVAACAHGDCVESGAPHHGVDALVEHDVIVAIGQPLTHARLVGVDDGDDAQVGVDLPKGTGDHAVDPSAVADDSQPRHRHIWSSSPSGIIVRT